MTSHHNHLINAISGRTAAIETKASNCPQNPCLFVEVLEPLLSTASNPEWHIATDLSSLTANPRDKFLSEIRRQFLEGNLIFFATGQYHVFSLLCYFALRSLLFISLIHLFFICYIFLAVDLFGYSSVPLFS